jgi:hypothetical protein
MTYPSIVHRVASRYLRGAGWNAMNGTYVTVMWNPSKWRLEEMANGEPIPATTTFGERGPEKVFHEMTTLKSASGNSALYRLFPSVEAIRVRAHVRTEDKGPEVRQKILNAYKAYFQEVSHSLKTEGDPAEFSAWQKLVPELEHKLVWKKVK